MDITSVLDFGADPTGNSNSTWQQWLLLDSIL